VADSISCLTNSCIAADVTSPKLIQALENGQTFTIELVDCSVLAVSTIPHKMALRTCEESFGRRAVLLAITAGATYIQRPSAQSVDIIHIE
jgi:invasion protein IalB